MSNPARPSIAHRLISERRRDRSGSTADGSDTLRDGFLGLSAWYWRMETIEAITGGVREYAVSEYLAICRGFRTPPISISQALADAVIDGDEGRLRAYLADPRRCEVLEDMVRLAAAHGNLRAVELLLPFCPSFTPVDGLIACTAAADNGHLSIVRFFIEEMEADATYGKMLTLATRGGHLDVVRYLCARGADVRMVDFEAVTEAAAGGHLEMIQYLVEHDVCMSKPRAPDALRSAARHGHIDIVVYLLERGLPAGIQAVNDAVAGGHLDIVQCLHAHGANVLGDELIAVQSAAEFNNLEILSFLISVGADINADGDRALLIAVVKGHVETVRFLHAHGAGRVISLADSLRMALRNGHTDLVVYLHERGADIRCNDDEAVRLAVSGGHMSILTYLHAHGANLHRGCDEAVVLAAPGGHLEMLSFLHTHGADLRTRNDAALRAAAEKRQWEAAGYLIRHGAAIANAKADDRGPLENYRAWMALHGRCPTALINLSRHYFRPEAFDDCLGFWSAKAIAERQPTVWRMRRRDCFARPAGSWHICASGGVLANSLCMISYSTLSCLRPAGSTWQRGAMRCCAVVRRWRAWSHLHRLCRNLARTPSGIGRIKRRGGSWRVLLFYAPAGIRSWRGCALSLTGQNPVSMPRLQPLMTTRSVTAARRLQSQVQVCLTS